MRKINIIFFISTILLFLTVSCSQQPDIDISTTIGKSENYFRQLEEIETTASAFDGVLRNTLIIKNYGSITMVILI